MVAAHEGGYGTTANKTAIEIYQCWKDAGLASFATAGLTGLRCHFFGTLISNSTANQMALTYRMYAMKVPGTALKPGNTELKSNTGGTFLFYEGTDGTNKGFKDTTLFTELYAATKGNSAVANTAGPVVLTKAA